MTNTIEEKVKVDTELIILNLEKFGGSTDNLIKAQEKGIEWIGYLIDTTNGGFPKGVDYLKVAEIAIGKLKEFKVNYDFVKKGYEFLKENKNKIFYT